MMACGRLLHREGRRFYLSVAAIAVLTGMVLLTAARPISAQTSTSFGSLASQLTPGQFSVLTTSGITEALRATGASGNIFGYTDDGVWDPRSQSFFFVGGDHNANLKFVRYSVATNGWQTMANPPFGGFGSWHGYDHSAINPATGVIYHRPVGSRTIYAWNGSSWSTLPANNILGSVSCCGAIEFFPQMGTQGSLIFVSGGETSSPAPFGGAGVFRFDLATNAWSRLASGVAMGGIHTFAEYNPVARVVVFGGGEGSRKLHKLSSTGQVTPLRDAPIGLGIQEALFTVDPVSGDFLVFQGRSGSTFYSYNVQTDTWTNRGTAPIFSTVYGNSVHGVVAAPVSTHGVTMFVTCNNSNCRVTLYKHAAGGGTPVPPPPADTAAPTVAITTPASAASLSGQVSVSASASDDVGVAGVRFFVDGTPVGVELTGSPYTISLDTRTLANGSHALTAVARDAAGNTRTSTAVNVSVNNASGDATPPTVSLSAPAPGASVSGTVTVSAAASDNVGVVGVQFKLNGVNLGAEVTGTAFNVSWNTASVSNGTHVLTAVARDAAGNTALATSVSVMVANSAPVPSSGTPSAGTPPPTSGILIPLTVREQGGAARVADAVTTGVPLPAGTQTTSWSLWDGSQEVPVQIQRLQGKANWILVDFQTSLASNGVKTLTLRDVAPQASPAPAIQKTETATTLTLNTGPLALTIRKDAFNLFENVTLNGATVATSRGSNIRLVNHAGTTFHANSTAPRRVVAEYQGPLRTTVRVDGDFSGWAGMGYTVRLTVYAGKPQVRVEYLVRNSLPGNQRHARLQQARLVIDTGTTVVRPARSGDTVVVGYPTGGLSFDLASTTGLLLPDLTHTGGTMVVDFTNPSSLELTRQLNASKSPLMALAPGAWYSAHGDMSVAHFATLEHERATYRNWGLTWSSSLEPRDTPQPDHYIGWVQVHSSLEADDTWQNLLMYLRTEGQYVGYFHRARAWSRYYKWEYAYRTDGFDYKWDGNYENPNDRVSRPDVSVGLTAADQTFVTSRVEYGKVDVHGDDDNGADHLFGFGLADWYHLTGDTDALEAMFDIAEVAWRMVAHRSPGSWQASTYGYRGSGRYFLMLERAAEMATDPVWGQRRNHVASLWQQAPDWDSTWGMYVWRSSFDSACTNPNTKVVMGGFHVHWAAWPLYRYYLDTGATWARDRLLAIGNFADQWGAGPANNGYTAVYIHLDCTTAGSVRYSSQHANYTTTWSDIGVMAYRLDGNPARLARSRDRWRRGHCNVYPAPAGQVCGFVNGTFLDGVAYVHEGYLSYGAMLLRDGGAGAPGSTPPTSDTTAPTVAMAAPAGGTTVSGTVTLRANASDNVGVAGVQFLLNGTNLGTQVGSPYTATWNSTTVPNGSYNLAAVARDAAGNSTTSSAVTVVVNNTGTGGDTTPPGAPGGLMATVVSGTQINLAWTAATDNVGVTGYLVERCQGASCTGFVQIATTTGTSQSNTGLAAGTAYRYRVRATDAAGNLGAYSIIVSATTTAAATPDTTAPSAPSSLAASAVSTTQINLTWNPSSDNVGVTGYRVERCQGIGCSSFTQIGTTTSPAYNNTGLAVNVAYSYRVRATDAAGNPSPYSSVASATTLASNPGPLIGLVAAYSFKEGAGTQAGDSSGNANHASITGATWTTQGRYGVALAFNGTTNFLAAPNATSLGLRNSGTISAWVRLTALNRWHSVIAKGGANSDPAHNYALEVTAANRVRCILGNGASDVRVDSTVTVTTGVFYHFACVWDGARLALFINGASNATTAQSITPTLNTAPLFIGQFGGGMDRLNGIIDEVRMYSRPLSQPEIQAIVNTGLAATFNLTTSKAGTGTGTVSSSPAGVSCGTDCSQPYALNTRVTLTATPAAGSMFAGWSGHADCADGVVIMTNDVACVATFNLITRTLTITKSGSGAGTVTSAPAGISCGTDCTEAYTSGAQVRLTVSPAANAIFAGWSGDADCADGLVTANANKTCIATFSLRISRPMNTRQVTPADSWCSVVNAARAGDEVVFAPGRYTTTCGITSKGTATAPILLRSGTDTAGNRATFQYSGTTHNVLELRDAAFMTIRGFQFAATQADIDAIRIVRANDVTIEDNVFEGIGGTAIRASNLSVPRLTIARNTFKGLRHAAMKLGCSDGVGCTLTEVMVEDNVIDGITPRSTSDAAFGIELRRNSSGTVRGNHVMRTRGAGILVEGAETARTIVEKNYVEGAATAPAIGIGGSRVTVRNNVLVRNTAGGIVVDAASPQREIWIVHNTLVDNGTVGIDVTEWGSGSSLDNVLAYNAILSSGGVPTVRPSAPSGTIRKNVTCPTAETCFKPNLVPAPGGPLVDEAGIGTESWRPTDDFGDTPRTGPADIGAIEAAP
jgi:chitodextrinase